MRKYAPLLSIPESIDDTASKIAKRFNIRGVTVTQSFSIDSACAPPPSGTCPHSGNVPCKCQLIVLQIHDDMSNNPPLVLHEFENRTDIYLVEENMVNHKDLVVELLGVFDS